MNQFTKQPQTVKRLIDLDFLRGVAIILVMIAHFRVPVTNNLLLDSFAYFFDRVGGVGVNLFFALSGFLVGGLLLKELKRNDKVEPIRFLTRRALKIWPSLYFLLFVHLVTGHHPIETYFWQNLFHVQNYFGSAIKQTWSLAVEEHFYIFLAFFISMYSKSSTKKLLTHLFIIACLSFFLRLTAVELGYLDAAFRQTQYRLDSLLFGVMLAVIYIFHNDLFERVAKCRFALFVSSFFMCYCIWTFAENPALDRNISYLVQAVGFPLLIVQTLTSEWRIRTTAIYKFIAWVGIYSYGIYLWHSATLGPAEKISQLLLNNGFGLSSTWFVVMIFQFSVSIMLGFVTTLIVEWPFLRLREKFFPAIKTS